MTGCCTTGVSRPMLDLPGSVFFQFASIVPVCSSSHSGYSMLFREVLLSARLKDYELEIPLTDEQSVPVPHSDLSRPVPVQVSGRTGRAVDGVPVVQRTADLFHLHNFCKGRGVQLHLKEKKDFGPVRS